MDLRIRIILIYSPCIKRHNNPKMLILFFLLSFISFFLFFFPFFQLPYFCQNFCLILPYYKAAPAALYKIRQIRHAQHPWIWYSDPPKQDVSQLNLNILPTFSCFNWQLQQLTHPIVTQLQNYYKLLRIRLLNYLSYFSPSIALVYNWLRRFSDHILYFI